MLHTPAPPQPAVIRLFLTDGTPEGLRLVEKTGWIGCAALFPRARFPELRSRAELKRTGVYLLLGESADPRQEVYIGEGDPVSNRPAPPEVPWGVRRGVPIKSQTVPVS